MTSKKPQFVLAVLSTLLFLANPLDAAPQFKGQGKKGNTFSYGTARGNSGANRGAGVRATPPGKGGGASNNGNRGGYGNHGRSNHGHNKSYSGHNHRHGHSHSVYRPNYGRNYYNPGRNSLSLDRFGLTYGYQSRSGVGLSFNVPLNRGYSYGYGNGFGFGGSSYGLSPRYGGFGNAYTYGPGYGYSGLNYGSSRFYGNGGYVPSYRPYTTPNYGTPGSFQPRPGDFYQPSLAPQRSNATSAAALALEQARARALTTETSLRTTPNLIATNSAAQPIQAIAERAFREGRYQAAVTAADKAISLDRDNGVLMLFSSQTKLAVGDYSNAFLEIEAATRRLPQEQWGSVVSRYSQVYGQDDYVGQIDRLSQYIKANPSRYLARALRGFHYGCLGYTDSALKDLNSAMKINPGDEAVSRLVAGFSPPALNGPINPPSISKPTLEAPVDMPVDQLPSNSVLETGPDDVVPGMIIPDSNTLPQGNSVLETEPFGSSSSSSSSTAPIIAPPISSNSIVK